MSVCFAMLSKSTLVHASAVFGWPHLLHMDSARLAVKHENRDSRQQQHHQPEAPFLFRNIHYSGHSKTASRSHHWHFVSLLALSRGRPQTQTTQYTDRVSISTYSRFRAGAALTGARAGA
jgi:hypothetical protein